MISRAAKYLSRYGDPTKRPDNSPLPTLAPSAPIKPNPLEHDPATLVTDDAKIHSSATPHHRLMAHLLHDVRRTISGTSERMKPTNVFTDTESGTGYDSGDD
nr:hypothetical protein B0A51_03799 [Rachicladosporium sp. CCFEE 5018]